MRHIPHLFFILSLTYLAGCATKPEAIEEGPLVYPPPPEVPRYYYEHTLVSTAQVRGDTRESRMRKFLTGEVDTGSGLSKPFDVSVCKGTIYVSDTVSRSVMAFDFSNERFYELGTYSPGELSKPMGIGTDDQCNVYVSDISAGTVFVYDKEGNFLKTIGEKSQFKRLTDVTPDPEGTRVFAMDTGGVTEDENHHIRVFDMQTGEHLYDIGTRGSGEGELNLPKSVAMGPNRKIYVVDSANFRVVVYEENGEHSHSFGSLGRRLGQLARPKGIAVSRDGLIFVSDASHGNFQIYNEQGQLLMFIGERSTVAARAKYLLPAGIDVDEDGRVYFVGQFYRKVDVFRPAALEPAEGYLGVWPEKETLKN